MSERFEDLGSRGSLRPLTREEEKRARRHRWKCTWQDFHVQKHVCRDCGATKLSKNRGFGFPKVEFQTVVDGKLVTTINTPKCKPKAL